MRRLRLYTYLITMLFCIVCKAANHHEWSASDIKIPFLSDSTLYVSDPDNYVSKTLKDSANYYLQRLRTECGVQNTFIIVGRVKDGDTFRMAQDVGNKYGIGSKDTRRGLVVVIAVEDHRYFIAPGMGLEEVLTDVDCNDIAQACIIPYMKANRPSEAVLATSKALFMKIHGDKASLQNIDNQETGEESMPFIIFLTILFFGYPEFLLIRYILQSLGIIKKSTNKRKKKKSHKSNDDDWFPPFFFGGGSGWGNTHHSGSGFSGGSFGGGSFGGGGSGGSW